MDKLRMDATGISGARWEMPGEPSVDAIRAMVVQAHCTPLVASLLLGRGISAQSAKSFLSPSFNELSPPESLSGISSAVELIVDCISRNGLIAIYGDYDVDGITSIAILSQLLNLAGARHQYYIPHRIDEGYGLQIPAIDQLADQGVNLLITVDCGISAVEAVQHANARSLCVIITDHHEPPAALPSAAAIVHPRVDSPSAYPQLCGAGVAHKLAWALSRRLCQSQKVSEPFRQVLLEATALAALGTIADVVPLTGDNRILVKYGLKALGQIHMPGLTALAELAQNQNGRVDGEYVGFSIAPRLNAAGRMGHAREALELLLSDNPTRAAELAAELDKLNRRRQQTDRKITEQAHARVAAMPALPSAIVVYDESWHAGVVGIVASRLVERFARPAFVFQQDGDLLSGSARGLPGFDVHAAIEHARHLIISGGGHAAAGGVKLRRENIAGFIDCLEKFAASVMPRGGFTKTLSIDAIMKSDEVDAQALHEIENMAPFGAANPRPRFLIQDAVIDSPPRLIGASGRTVALRLRIGNQVFDAVGFGLGTHATILKRGAKVAAVVEFKPSGESRFRKLQFRLLDFALRSSDPPAACPPLHEQMHKQIHEPINETVNEAVNETIHLAAQEVIQG